MLPKPLRALWGDLSGADLKKFGILSAVMMLIVGNYWMLRVTKDPLFNLLVGYRQWQPIVKMVSLGVMIFVVLGYSKLVDLLKKHSLIYVMCAFYGSAFLALSFLISHPDFLSVSSTSSFYKLVSWIPGKGIGWFAYILLESYGSLLIALFYSFIASVMTTDLAKKGYGFMFVFIQMGTVFGILVEMFVVKKIGFSMLYLMGGVIVLIAPFIIKLYMSVFADEIEVAQKSHHENKKKTGFLEGAKLILTRPYVMGLFVVASFYEIISTIVEYQMGYVATGFYSDAEFAVFKGIQGLGINLLSLVFAFAGTSFFMRRFGLRFCLMAFPITIGVVVVACLFAHQLGIGDYPLMWVLLGAAIVIKGFNYALNKPSSEVMYIPTSKDVKFKAKSWVDMFGLRSTKAVGSTVSTSFNYSFAPLMLYGTIISLGVIGVWVFVAAFVGTKFNALQEENKIVE